MDKSNENIETKYWLNNKQVASSFAVFILLGIGYGEFRGVLGKSVLHDTQITDNKALIYTKSREGSERATRMVAPLRKDIDELMAWKNYQQGYEDGLKAKQ